jgi:hypothetical protein
VSDDAALHQVDQHGRNPGLHYVSTEHDDDRAFFFVCADDCFDYGFEIRGNENVRQCPEKCGE